MKRIFSPAISLMNRLRVSQKLIGLALICLAAYAGVGLILYSHLSETIDISKKELEGIASLRVLTRTMQLVQQHRGLSAGLLGGDKSMREARATKTLETEASFNEVAGQLSPELASSEGWSRIKTDWESIRRTGLDWSASKSFSAHNNVLEEIQAFRMDVADRHLLVADPEIDVHYRIELAVVILPVMLEKLGQIRGLGTEILAAKKITEHQKFQMHALIAGVHGDRKLLYPYLDKAARFSPQLSGRITDSSRHFEEEMVVLLGLVQSDVMDRRFGTSSGKFFAMASGVIDSGYLQVQQSLLPTTEMSIKARIRRAEAELLLTAGMALLLVLIGYYLFSGVYFSTVDSIQSLALTARKFSLGDTSQRVSLNTHDEFLDVGDSFNEMANGLDALLTARMEGEARLRGIVDSALDALIQMDSGGRIFGWSAQAERIFGWTREEAVGRMLHETIIPVRYRDAHVKGLSRYLASGQGPVMNKRIEIEGLHRAGHEFPIELTIASIKTERDLEFSAFVRDITERKQSEFDLKTTNMRLGALIEAIPDAIFLKDAASRWLVTNEAAKHLFRLHDIPWQGKTEMELAALHPEFRAAHETCLMNDEKAWEAGRLALFDEVIIGEGGQRHDFEVRKMPVFDEQGRRQVLVIIGRDITARKAVDNQLRKLSLAVEQSPESIVITNLDATIEYVNEAFVRNTGYSSEELIGQTPRILHGTTPPETYRALWDAMSRGESWDGEFYNMRKDGSTYIEHAIISPLRQPDGTITHYVGVKEDITRKKAAEYRIHELAYYDPLTSLPNRRLLLDRLGRVMASSARTSRYGALLLIDLDNFKALNDTLGHDIGDLLLRKVAERLSVCVREGDTVARLGGDEFVVLLEDLSEDEAEAATQAEIVGAKVLAALNQSYQLASYVHHSTPSIGITLLADHQDGIDELMKRAELAMYQAKAAGRNNLRFFDPEMQSVVRARAELEADLREAILKGQFLVHYQAQVDGAGHITGAEVLVRWQHPERGLVSPFGFIALTEDTGLILPLGRWVLETACAQLAVWAARPEMAHLTIAVNVSARQFHHRDFVSQVLEILECAGANPQRLKLELTESLLVHDIDGIIAKMTALKAAGVSFSMDDFGTGYSSLSYLNRLPFDQLKIDQSFVANILSDPNNVAIASAIVALGQSLGLAVIAEGVETEGQRDCLAANGCHAYQGFLFNRPMAIDDFERYAQG